MNQKNSAPAPVASGSLGAIRARRVLDRSLASTGVTVEAGAVCFDLGFGANGLGAPEIEPFGLGQALR